MERSESTASKEDDVTAAAEETLQFDDDTLRGENLGYHLLSIIKNQRRRNCTWLDTNV